MKRILWVAAALLCLTLAGTAFAQEQAPQESPLENVCYAGGEWEYKCAWPTEDETEWAWTCGWYYAAVQSAKISLEQAPEWCKLFFEIAEEQFALCIDLGDDFAILLIGEPNVPGNSEFYQPTRARDLSPCSELTPVDYPTMWIQLPTEPAPLDLLDACAAFDPSIKWNIVDAISAPGLPGFNYLCSAVTF